MDEQLLSDIKQTLKDALECEDWNCVTDAIDAIREYQGEFDDDDEEMSFN